MALSKTSTSTSVTTFFKARQVYTAVVTSGHGLWFSCMAHAKGCEKVKIINKLSIMQNKSLRPVARGSLLTLFSKQKTFLAPIDV